MARKRIKATFLDLPRFCESHRVVAKDDPSVKGTRFTLCDRLTEKERNYLSTFKNISFGTVTYRYAPEIVHDTVIILDKCYN